MAFTNVGECWKRVHLNGRDYLISNHGNMATFCLGGGLGRAMKLRLRKGYLTVSITGPDRKFKVFYVHRIVMEAFVGPRMGHVQVNHKDMNRTNNRLENLEYVTQSENMVHAIKIRGHHNAKLTESDVRCIRAAVSGGKPVGVVAKSYGVSQSVVSNVVNRKTWKYVA